VGPCCLLFLARGRGPGLMPAAARAGPDAGRARLVASKLPLRYQPRGAKGVPGDGAASSLPTAALLL
jgi:hypothetical protein